MEAIRRSPFGAPAPDLATLAASLRGTLLQPGDEGYDEARTLHNTVFDRRPTAIVRAADASDVARAVTFARANGLEIAVRAGGHSVAGHSVVDDGLMIDLTAMKGLLIDPLGRIARAEAGLTAGEYTAAAAEFGLATPFGDTPSVGIAGLTLGGGIGYLVRKHGLAIDSLRSVEVVTADGRIVNASPDENQDLFWAIRGGGGNFGIVTRFTYRLHEVGMTYGGGLILPASRAVIRGLMDYAAQAPRELSIIAFVLLAPPLPFIPADRVGELSVLVTLVYSGDPTKGAEVVAPIRALAEPIADLLMPMPYPGIYKLTGAAAQPGRSTIRGAFLDELTDEQIEAILARHAAPSSPMAMTQLRVLGGALADVTPDATAFAHRERKVLVMLITAFQGDAAPHEAWTQRYYDEVFAPGTTGAYANFLGDEGDARIRSAYPGDTYDRLAAIKRRWDPTNVFHRNQNIRPMATAG